MLHYAALIAAGQPRYRRGSRQPRSYLAVSSRHPANELVTCQCQVQAMNRDIELKFGCIDSSRRCVTLCHLLRPCLVKRTKLFRQPSGSDEGAGAITLRGSQKRLRMGSIRSPAACRGLQSAAGHSFSEQADNNLFCYYKDGQRCTCAVPTMILAQRVVGTLRFAPYKPAISRREEKNATPRSRDTMRPRFARNLPPKIKRGRRECRVLNAPIASHAK